MELSISVSVKGDNHTTKNPIKEALLMRVQQLERLLEFAAAITSQEDHSVVPDLLMKMSKKSNHAGYRLLGSELVSLVISDDLADFCETHRWPESVQRLLDTITSRREVCLQAAMKIEG